MNVLIVEDDAVTEMLITSNVLQWGYKTHSVNSAEAAIAFLEQQTDFYIVITDWSLGGMPGTELAAYIKENFASMIYIIMLTNRSDEENLVHAMEKGVDDFISKPFRPAELRVRIRAGARLVEKSLKLAFLASFDELTQVWNRRMLTEQMEIEWQRHKREQTQLCIAILDLDRFKNINDSFGHAAGDRVLQKFGQVLQKQSRPYDLIGRFGGEEFVVMFPNTSIDDAKKICERFRTTLESEEFAISDRSINVTVSIGLASDHKNTTSYTDVLNKADEALYKAKGSGRNRTEVWTSGN